MKNASVKKVLVVGASSGTGRAVVESAARAGHQVTALARSAGQQPSIDGVTWMAGDATQAADLDAAVRAQDAVVVTLGISENPLRVRIAGPGRTPIDVRSRGTHHVIEAMKRHRVPRLVVLTTYGVGPTESRLGFVDRLVFSLLLKPQIADTKLQQSMVEASGLDWVIAQPVHLFDGEDEATFLSDTGETAVMKVSRRGVAKFMVEAATNGGAARRSIAISGVAAPG